MEHDIITLSIARIGLLNGAIAVVPSPRPEDGNVPVFSAAGRWDVLDGCPGTDAPCQEFLKSASLEPVAQAAARTLARLSLSGSDAYDAMAAAVSDAGTFGTVLLRPRGGNWPDALSGACPGLLDERWPAVPADRVFPAAYTAELLAYEDGDGAADTDGWCRDNPGALLKKDLPSQDLTAYYGWNESLGRAVACYAAHVDFRKPWMAVRDPDGGERVAPASPMSCLDRLMNCWEPMASQGQGG